MKLSALAKLAAKNAAAMKPKPVTKAAPNSLVSDTKSKGKTK